jgi:hypothetical protein
VISALSSKEALDDTIPARIEVRLAAGGRSGDCAERAGPREPTLIALAYAFEQATHHRVPPASVPALATDHVVK